MASSGSYSNDKPNTKPNSKRSLKKRIRRRMREREKTKKKMIRIGLCLSSLTAIAHKVNVFLFSISVSVSRTSHLDLYWSLPDKRSTSKCKNSIDNYLQNLMFISFQCVCCSTLWVWYILFISIRTFMSLTKRQQLQQNRKLSDM